MSLCFSFLHLLRPKTYGKPTDLIGAQRELLLDSQLSILIKRLVSKPSMCFGLEISPGDKDILAALKAAVESVTKDRHVRLGCIASGDVFVSKGNLKQVLHGNFGADVAEMEGASIAHVASTANVPFAVIRAVSDLADGSAPASFAEFDAEASHIAAMAVRRFCKSL